MYTSWQSCILCSQLPVLTVTICSFCLAASSQTCDPVEGNTNPWLFVKEMQIGCWTNFISEDNREVHILNLVFSPQVSLRSVVNWKYTVNLILSKLANNMAPRIKIATLTSTEIVIVGKLHGQRWLSVKLSTPNFWYKSNAVSGVCHHLLFNHSFYWTVQYVNSSPSKNWTTCVNTNSGSIDGHCVWLHAWRNNREISSMWSEITSEDRPDVASMFILITTSAVTMMDHTIVHKTQRVQPSSQRYGWFKVSVGHKRGTNVSKGQRLEQTSQIETVLNK